jgi:hypothetical protein
MLVGKADARELSWVVVPVRLQCYKVSFLCATWFSSVVEASDFTVEKA